VKRAKLAELLGEIREDLIEEAAPPARTRVWQHWAALAACCCMIFSLGAFLTLFSGMGAKSAEPEAERPPQSAEPGDAPEMAPEMEEEEESELEESGDMLPHVVVDGVTYYHSSHLSSYDECPDGFTLAGVIGSGEFAGTEYYRNPAQPQLVYLYTMTNNRGEVDDSGTVIPTEPHMAFVRYADETIRGKDFLCHDGTLYIAMWSANTWAGTRDVSEAFFNSIHAKYGYRIEGALPEGFASVGIAEFSGYDIWPEGPLSSNRGEVEVFVNPDDPDVVLVAAVWHSAKGRHEGFDVFLRYEGQE